MDLVDKSAAEAVDVAEAFGRSLLQILIVVQVVRDQEKVIIWCQLPAVTVLLFAIFKMLHIEVITVSAFQKPW